MRLIDLLIRLYPRDFRERYGAEMRAFHQERARDGAAIWVREIPDHLTSATLLAVSALLALVAVVASILPARRAMAVSPTDALRGG
jgi:ABC-type lipoprotein release transport system permease subunit